MNWVKTGRYLGVIFSTLIIFLCGAAVVWAFSWDAPSRVTGAQNAEPILRALNRYQRVKGVYPNRLNDLVAGGYLDSIPKPGLTFQRYVYDYGMGINNMGIDYLYLGFIVPGPHWFCYDLARQQWEDHDDDC